ncbi:uncharacterized protein BP5553_10621 [Venustampulla echinocandica]|uniref:Multicopper oxidase n=1 Tax=Venustampulla echinocandica TaxID=2656787 RepID=A0A370T926_9HELO|nr:uncharacterized protein BP5553_10621 [Venustampulla echinocandica]RDL29994.1 hypothetical protein BP5553_10621 [Venustampulla echinocandica]
MRATESPRRKSCVMLTSLPTDVNESRASAGLLADDERDAGGCGSPPEGEKRDEGSCGDDEVSRRYGNRSKYLRLVGLIFAVILLTLISISSYMKLLLSTSNISPLDIPAELEDGDGDRAKNSVFGIQLHPEYHAERVAKTITHHWSITSDYRFPDGVKKSVYLVNGQFPGPTIECRSGDRLVIHITNELSTDEGVSIHWHGLHMRNSNAMDGAVGFTQCPVPKSRTFSYEFDIDQDQHGTFWWHAHSEVQRGDGMYGGLVVHRPSAGKTEMEEYGYERDVLLLIGDWYHRTAGEVLDWYTSVRGFGNEPVPDSLLVNGVGRFICSMAVPARPVECSDITIDGISALLGSNKDLALTRLRVVNVGSLAGFTLGISSGTFTPLKLDGGRPISGSPSNSVGVLYPGERVDLLLKVPNQDAVSSSLHINLDPENFKFPNPALRPNQTFSLISSVQDIPISDRKRHALDNSSNFDLGSAISAEPNDSNSSFPEHPHQIILLYIRTEKLAKFANHPMGFINRTSWLLQNNPALPLISLTRSQWDSNQFVPWVPTSQTTETWVDIILNNLDDGAHPFHLHGHDFYVLASYRSEHGWGSYSPYASSGSSALKPKLNLKNPLRKDTVAVPRRGYVVLRFRADNPGIWMLHCHVLFHQASGMAMGILVGGNDAHDNLDLVPKESCQNVD